MGTPIGTKPPGWVFFNTLYHSERAKSFEELNSNTGGNLSASNVLCSSKWTRRDTSENILDLELGANYCSLRNVTNSSGGRRDTIVSFISSEPNISMGVGTSSSEYLTIEHFEDLEATMDNFSKSESRSLKRGFENGSLNRSFVDNIDYYRYRKKMVLESADFEENTLKSTFDLEQQCDTSGEL